MALRLSQITTLRTLDGTPLDQGEWFRWKATPLEIRVAFQSPEAVTKIREKARAASADVVAEDDEFHRAFAEAAFKDFRGLTPEVVSQLWPGMDAGALSKVPSEGVDASLDNKVALLDHPATGRWIYSVATNRSAYVAARQARREAEAGNSTP